MQTAATDIPHHHHGQPALLSVELVRRAAVSAVRKLSPLHQLRNPVMFVVYVGAWLLTVQCLTRAEAQEPYWFILAITGWLWTTVLFANFAEAIAEGRGRAQADALRRSRRDVKAKRLEDPENRMVYDTTDATALRVGDVFLVEAGDTVPADGQVLEGVAAVDESAITGESAPVIRENGGDRDALTAGTRVLSDWLVVRVTTNPGESYIDRMIAMVEGAKRQKTPNEVALGILLAALTIVFLLATATLYPFSLYSVGASGSGQVVGVATLVALLVCLAPTSIGGLLSAIGIAGMNRLIRANVIATSGRAVEAAGDVNVLLLDKTGTITLGNRQAVAFLAADGVPPRRLADAAEMASLADDTPEGKSIVVLARQAFGIAERSAEEIGGTFIPFSADTRVSGVEIQGRKVLKGASDAIAAHVHALGGAVPPSVEMATEAIAKQGGTPLVVVDGVEVLGVVHLKDIIKTGIKERLSELRRMGIKSVMITGDNPLTAAAIASEAGVDDFLAQATPETKLQYIRRMQEGGELVAMVGDGTNDAPALAQADVAVAMNSGTQAAKEAGNMVDLDSDPTKLIEIVEIGKQLLMTRGALTTFSIANDIAKYFAIIPAAFASTYPALGRLDVMGLASPQSAILSAVIFNALVIIGLVPLALRGVAYRPVGAEALLKHNVAVYGVGGLVVPFAGIKLIDLVLSAAGAV